MRQSSWVRAGGLAPRLAAAGPGTAALPGIAACQNAPPLPPTRPSRLPGPVVEMGHAGETPVVALAAAAVEAGGAARVHKPPGRSGAAVEAESPGLC